MTSRCAALSSLLVLLACTTGLEPVREDHFFSRAELLVRLAQIQVGLDRVKPLLVADQGRSFQLDVVDRVSRHVAVTARRLPERSAQGALQAGAVGVNLAGLAYDAVRLDAGATYIGLGGVVHTPARQMRSDLFEAMDHFEADPTWANKNVDSVERSVLRLCHVRDNAADQLANANFMRAGVQSAAVTSGALGMVELSLGGAVAFTRLIELMKASGAEIGSLAVVGQGGAVALQFAAAGKAITLTEVEIAALVDAGILSAASWNLMMMTSGRSKRVDPKRFQRWVDSREKRPAPRGTPAAEYQVKHCGEDEFLVSAENGAKVWADGVRPEEAALVEAKHVGSSDRSPYLPGSGFPDKLRLKVRADLLEQLQRYAEVVRDPTTPATAVEIVTNHPDAVELFEQLLQEAGVPGKVVVRP
jgi:hypothetical protein